MADDHDDEFEEVPIEVEIEVEVDETADAEEATTSEPASFIMQLRNSPNWKKEKKSFFFDHSHRMRH